MNTIILFLSLALASLAEASIAPQSGPPPFCCGFQKPRKIHIQSLDNSLPMHGALNLRGGGSNIRLPIDNSRILSFVIAFHAFNGVVGLAAPEILAEKVYMYHPVKEGSFAQLCHEFFGAGATSLALTLYLSGDKSTFDAVAIGTLPLAYVTFRHLLKGTSTTLGLHKGAWDVLMAQFFVGIYALLTRVSNTDRIAKIYAMVPTIIGLSGMLDLNYSKALWGIEVIDFPTESAYRWMSRILFQCGTLFLLLLRGWSTYKATAYIALAYAVQCLDFAYVTRDREGCPNQPKWFMNAFAALWGWIGVSLLQ